MKRHRILTRVAFAFGIIGLGIGSTISAGATDEEPSSAPRVIARSGSDMREVAEGQVFAQAKREPRSDLCTFDEPIGLEVEVPADLQRGRISAEWGFNAKCEAIFRGIRIEDR